MRAAREAPFPPSPSRVFAHAVCTSLAALSGFRVSGPAAGRAARGSRASAHERRSCGVARMQIWECQAHGPRPARASVAPMAPRALDQTTEACARSAKTDAGESLSEAADVRRIECVAVWRSLLRYCRVFPCRKVLECFLTIEGLLHQVFCDVV